MKVLHVLPSLSPNWGGPVSVVIGLTRALERQGVQHSVIATFGMITGHRPVPPPTIKAELFRTDLWGWLWIGHAPQLAEAVRREVATCDLVHIHELWHYPHWVAARIASHYRRPYIISPHGEFSGWALRQKALAKRIYAPVLLRPSLRRASAVHALSDSEAQQIRDFGVGAPVHVIPNGVPAELVHSQHDRQAALTMWPELRDKRVALFLGRLQSQKGPDVLIEAWRHVQRQLPTAHLVLAGPAEARVDAALRARVQQLGLTAIVTFTGALYGAQKAAALAAADVFVLPSRSEGQSVALLEAMAAALPVVVTPAANYPDVTAADAGVVSRLAPADLGQAIARVLADPSLATRLGCNGRSLVKREFTWESVARSVAAMYATYVAQAGAR